MIQNTVSTSTFILRLIDKITFLTVTYTYRNTFYTILYQLCYMNDAINNLSCEEDAGSIKLQTLDDASDVQLI